VKLDRDYTTYYVDSLDDALDFKQWIGERRHGDWLGVDIETSGLNLGRDRIRLCQFGDLAKGWALDWERWKGVCVDVLPTYDRPTVAHNLSFDAAFLKRDGCEIPQLGANDTMIMAHLVNPVSFIGLKPLAARLVGPEALMGKDDLTDAMRAMNWSWGTVPTDHPAYHIYGCLDTSLAVAIAHELWPIVRDNYLRVYEVEMGALHVLRDARLAGMRIDMDYAVSTRAQLLSDMEQLRTRIPCDPGKDQQVRDLIEATAQRGPLGSWWPFRTDTGAVSVDKDALEHFESEFPVLIPPLKEWRKKSKLVGTYLNNIIGMAEDDLLHPNIKQVAARTSRMSITEPALQTLPRGTEVRDAFVPTEGSKLLLADYQAMELRMLAYFAECTPMIDAFNRGEDLHSWVAAQVSTGGDLSLVTKQMRAIAKGVQFGKIYGAGVNKISLTAGVDVSVAEAFLNRYDELFPQVRQFQMRLMETMHQRLRDDGEMWVKTILGRRLPVDRDKPYVGTNYICQASATSDLIKLKLCELDAAGLGPYIRLPVHDEIIFEVPDEDVADARVIVERVMPETQLTYPVTMAIESDVVARWGDHYR
jgi:DNA polymerase I-like protein with 3'-5' exonuclease and polymerase domains